MPDVERIGFHLPGDPDLPVGGPLAVTEADLSDKDLVVALRALPLQKPLNRDKRSERLPSVSQFRSPENAG